MYESTTILLEHLYPKLSKGGYVIIDDYGMLENCTQAVEDYRKRQGITEELRIIGYANGNPIGAFWKKERAGAS